MKLVVDNGQVFVGIGSDRYKVAAESVTFTIQRDGEGNETGVQVVFGGVFAYTPLGKIPLPSASVSIENIDPTLADGISKQLRGLFMSDEILAQISGVVNEA